MTTSTVTYSTQTLSADQQAAQRDALASVVGSYVSTAARQLDMPAMIESLAELDPTFPVADYHDALDKLRRIHAALQAR